MIKKTAKSPKDLQTGTAERLCVLTWDNLSSFSPQTVCDIGVVVYFEEREAIVQSHGAKCSLQCKRMNQNRRNEPLFCCNDEIWKHF